MLRRPIAYIVEREGGQAMAKNPKVIVTCAVTGSIHTPTMSPHLPITASEIADAANSLLESNTEPTRR